MSMRVEPGLHREIARFGGGDVTACMNCGNCTATCPQTMDGVAFPRRVIHLLQVGHRDRLRSSLEPWLCYYCGDCSTSCPRDANPAATMMAARRYLTAQYDWTGIGARLYRSPAVQLAAVIGLALLVGLAMLLFHGPVVTDRMALNTFAPVETIELADWTMAAVLAALLLSNGWRMYRFVSRRDGAPPVPFRVLVGEAKTFVLHFFTQRRWRECETARPRWLTHLLLVTGYVSMMLLVEVGLRWFQTDAIRPVWHWTRLLGYWATGVLLYGSVVFLVARARKEDWIHRHSEPSDWVFIVLLFLVALTGILVHVLRLAGLPVATYVTYTVHLMVVAPFLILQVPFGKWSHMFYRPFAVYLDAVRRRVQAAAAPAMERAA
jgi:ferredoxin